MNHRPALFVLSAFALSLYFAGETFSQAPAGTPAWHNEANPGPVYLRQPDAGPTYPGQPATGQAPSGQPAKGQANPGSQIRPAGNFSPAGQAQLGPAQGPPVNQLPLERQALGQQQQAAAAQPPGAYAAAAAAPQALPAPPFRLTPEQEQAVDALLQAWQQKQVKDFSANFTRWDYDPNMAPPEKQYLFREATGFIKYQAPDKGQFKVDAVKELNMKKAKKWDDVAKIFLDLSDVTYDPLPDANQEWRCNGKSIFEFDVRKKQLIEHKLPPHLQGKAIIDTPLPFVFGADAKKIKERYWVRIVTPPDEKGKVWLEAVPRWQRDAANYERVQIILAIKETELVPVALQVYQPGEIQPSAGPGGAVREKARQVYMFTLVKEPWNPFATDFSSPSTPFGWKKVVDDPTLPQAEKPLSPSPSDPNREARQPAGPTNPTMRK